MAYSVQKSTVAKVAVVSLAMLLAACSSDQRYKRQVSGDEAYLQATPLADLHAPAGMILPVQNGKYDIPVVRSSTAIGKELDIRPPTQALALVNGGRTAFAGDTATLLVEAALANGLWPQVVSVLQEKTIPLPNVAMVSRPLPRIGLNGIVQTKTSNTVDVIRSVSYLRAISSLLWLSC